MSKLKSHKWRKNAAGFRKKAKGTVLDDGTERREWSHFHAPVSVVLLIYESAFLPQCWQVTVNGTVRGEYRSRAAAFAAGQKAANALGAKETKADKDHQAKARRMKAQARKQRRRRP